jgi:hypothetical protein
MAVIDANVGFNLALAERLAVPFWTADRRLFQATRRLRLGWVHWAGPATANTAGP